MHEFSPRQKKDIKVLTAFIVTYCTAKHPERRERVLPEDVAVITENLDLCEQCHELLVYALGRLRRCPLDPKPSCKKCPIHCYRPQYRQAIREIMAFSGRRLVMRGRLDYLWHYLF